MCDGRHFDEHNVSKYRHRNADDTSNRRDHAYTSLSHALIEKEDGRDMERSCKHRQREVRMCRNYAARNGEH